jgi:hypothetical protein
MKKSKRELAHDKQLMRDSSKPGKQYSGYSINRSIKACDTRRTFIGDVNDMIYQYRWYRSKTPIHFILKMESYYTNGRELAEQACEIVESPLYQAMQEPASSTEKCEYEPTITITNSYVSNGYWVITGIKP